MSRGHNSVTPSPSRGIPMTSMPSRLSRATRTAAVAGASALVLSGCGGLASQSGTTSADAAASCGDSVTIGAPYPFSGPFTEFGNNAYQGMDIAAKEINDAGGIKALGGTKIKLAKGDTGSADPAQASSAATKLIDGGAIALVGSWGSPQTNSASTVAEGARVPLVTQSWSDQLSARDYQYYFQPPPKSSQMGGASSAYLTAAANSIGVKFTKVVGVGPNDTANVGQITAAVKAFADAGAAAGEPDFYQAGLSDASPIVNRVAAQNPDLILTSGSPADAVLIVKGLRERGVTAPIMGFGGAFVAPSFAKNLGDTVNGLIAVTAWNDDLPLDGVEAATKSYRETYSEAFMPMEAGESWVNVHLVAEALETSKSCDPEKITEALRSLNVTKGPAAAMPGGQVSFSKDGTNPHAVPLLTQWQDRLPKTVWPENYASSKLSLG
ncbi:ABC transporter substrate-binding protein [Pseudarthrobacter sp. NKDBFgelt]|uniref:ABC transporter substrate-binding protein n=1 Tax=Pseudarthrobacter sp. NKDBFgelt TaxID=3384443 RepID=UPI0038D501F1